VGDQAITPARAELTNTNFQSIIDVTDALYVTASCPT